MTEPKVLLKTRKVQCEARCWELWLAPAVSPRWPLTGPFSWDSQASNTYALPALLAWPSAPTTAVVPEMATE